MQFGFDASKNPEHAAISILQKKIVQKRSCGRYNPAGTQVSGSEEHQMPFLDFGKLCKKLYHEKLSLTISAFSKAG